jgi:hypothetical protein
VARTTPGGWAVRERRGTAPRRRLVSALVAVTAVLSAGAVGVALSALDRPDQSFRGTATAAGGTALVILALAYLRCRTSLLHVAGATAAGFTALAAGKLVENGNLLAGLACFGVGAVWAALTLSRVLDELSLGVGAAGVLMFIGAEELAFGDQTGPGLLLLGLLALAGLGGYVGTRMVATLVVGVAALATVVPQAVLHYSHGALGSGAALLVIGLSIVGASVLGLRLRRDVPPAG